MSDAPTNPTHETSNTACSLPVSYDCMPLLFDVKTAAATLNIGLRTLWRLTTCGAIPSVNIGRSVRYRPEDLRAWVALGCPDSPGAAKRVREAVQR